uniref:CUB domain-containing protein n=1 Tax=Meloidogyne javanica TaxID=6303 RepID=A0A915MLJ7_MELJA
MSKIFEFCGDELPAQLMSANNVLTLTYVLKSALIGRGINQFSDNNEESEESFYPRNVDCQYVFLGAKDQVVFVTFEYFDVEGRGQCDDKAKSDFVLFSNYRTRDRTNRRFCGALKPKDTIKSESNYFRMIFHSNDIFDGTGFFARYQFFDQGILIFSY